MELKLPGIAGREKVAPEKRNQQHRRQTNRQERGNQDELAINESRQYRLVRRPQSLESALKGTLKEHQRIARRPAMLLLAQQVHRERGNQRSRKDIRSDHGEHHCFGERHEQILRYTAQEEHRNEDDTDTERRNQRGQG